MPDSCAEQDHRCAKTPSSEQSARLVGPAPLVESLLRDGLLGKGFYLESIVRDRYPAFDRPAIGAPRDALLGAPDGGELLAEVGCQGDGDRLRFESPTGVAAISGLLALEGSFGTDLADLLYQQGFDARSLAGNEFTDAKFIHDRLQVRPAAPAR